MSIENWEAFKLKELLLLMNEDQGEMKFLDSSLL